VYICVSGKATRELIILYNNVGLISEDYTKIQRPKAENRLKIFVFDYPTVVWVSLHSDFCCRLRKTHALRTGNGVRNIYSRSSNVIDLGTNRKCVCNFVLVIYSNLGPIFPRFRDIAGFLLRTATPPTFHPNFGVITSKLTQFI